MINKYLPPETKIHGLLIKTGPNPNTIIFSRANHDFRALKGTEYYIDGGQSKGAAVGLGMPTSAKAGVDYDFVSFELYRKGTMVKLTHIDLHSDWNNRIDKLGIVKADDETVINLTVLKD